MKAALFLKALGLFFSHIVAVYAASRYDTLVDGVEKLAMRASQAHNAGDHAGAKRAMEEAILNVNKAIKIEPGNPQAYLTGATLFLNTQQFAESLRHWDMAKERLEPNSPYHEMIKERKQHTRLGLVSTQRDRVYAHGKGNISAATFLVQEQIKIYESPRFYFDLATMQVMLAEVDPAKAAEAIPNFAKAQEVTFPAAAAFLRRLANKGKGGACPTQTRTFDVNNVAQWPEHVSIKGFDGTEEYGETYTAKAGFVASTERVSLYGQTAVVGSLYHDKCQFNLYGSSSWPFLLLHGELWIEEVWKGIPRQFLLYDHFHGRYPRPDPSSVPKRLASAASVVSYAASNYYHFLMETIPRILMLRATLEDTPEMKLIVPKDISKNKFIGQFLRLFPWLDAKRVIHWDMNGTPGERVIIDKLSWADWPQVKSSSGLTTHLLTPSMHLRTAQKELRAAMGLVRSKPSQHSVVFLTRGQDSGRKLVDEGALVGRLSRELSKANVKLVMFDGKALTVPEQAQIFADASVVVGVHGAAFANTLFCNTGVLVAELAFQSAFTHHYQHTSAALGFKHQRFPLQTDERGVGSPEVKASQATMDDLVSTVVSHATSHSQRDDL